MTLSPPPMPPVPPAPGYGVGLGERAQGQARQRWSVDGRKLQLRGRGEEEGGRWLLGPRPLLPPLVPLVGVATTPASPRQQGESFMEGLTGLQSKTYLALIILLRVIDHLTAYLLQVWQYWNNTELYLTNHHHCMFMLTGCPIIIILIFILSRVTIKI